ncbi:MAG: cupredoxin domain-containing protein [Candidatus Woesearchaeota archaeon]
MRKILIACSVIVILFFTACTSSSNTSSSSNNTDNENLNDLTANIVANNQNKIEPTTKAFDMRIVNLQFEPNTIFVNKGDRVFLYFLNEKPIHFSLDAFGVSEYVRTGSIEFVADKTGSFNFVCDNCENYRERPYFQDDINEENNQTENRKESKNNDEDIDKVILGVIYVK